MQFRAGVLAGLVGISWIFGAFPVPASAEANLPEAQRFEIQFEGKPFEYFLYVPTNYKPDRKWYVFVSVHAVRSKGSDMTVMFIRDADRDGFLLLCPSFDGNYFKLDAREDEALIQVLKEVAKKFNIQPRIFITGISGGADFALGFALKHPEVILACSLHSVTVYLPSEMEAIKRHFPIVVTCGKEDKESLERTPVLAERLKQHGFSSVQEAYYEGVGLAWNDEAQELCRELFRAASTGLSKEQRSTLEEFKLQVDQENFNESLKSIGQLLKSVRQGPYHTALKEMVKQIENEGLSRLKALQEALKEEPDTLVNELENLARQFPGTDVQRQARLAIQAARKKTAGVAVPDNETGNAGRPGGDEGGEAAASDRKARSLLTNAKNLMGAGNKKAAASTLRQIIDRHPQSSSAEEARKLLTDLGE
ncbi:MAG: hypothetical protein HYU36_18860 [Planctomycetes bacterium]|nr:hypothetical protein [Planctomycetota bacterium]